jgi:hypothetical protein
MFSLSCILGPHETVWYKWSLEENEYIGNFFFGIIEFFYGEIAGLLRGLPQEIFQRFPRFDGEGFARFLGLWYYAQSRSFRNAMIFCWMDSKSAMPLPERLLPQILENLTTNGRKSPEKR